MCKSFPAQTGFEIMKESWRATEAWHQERPGEVIAEDAASAAVESPGLNGPWRGAESRYCVAGSEALKRTQE